MRNNIIPRVVAAHDMSGFGRCSLTSVIPILSVMGIQVCPIPTAVLSTHTGGFEGYTFADLTDTLPSYIRHWRELNLSFDCFYSGFLADKRQIAIMLDFLELFNMSDRLIVVDPVFADNGKLYATFGKEFTGHMHALVKKAHIITPNMTEACFLLGREYSKSISKREAKEMLRALSALGPGMSVITSVYLHDKYGAVAYDSLTDSFWHVESEYFPAEYPGTGDIFASVMTGSLLKGDSLPLAMDKAVRFISLAIRTTYGYFTPFREGVLLEKVLQSLINSDFNVGYTIL